MTGQMTLIRQMKKMSRYIDILNRGKDRLKKAGISDFNTDAWLLFEEAFFMNRAAYFVKQLDLCGDDKAEESFDKMISVRCTRVPLQHITGHQEFMGLDFKVNEHTLIPRQDTETLVEEALHYINELKKNKKSDNSRIRVLDMCTGSGCIAVSIGKLAAVKGNIPIEVIGSDISHEALKVAELNKSIHKAENVAFLESSLFEFCSDTPERRWDMIISNPPYIRTSEIDELADEVRLHDPRLALDGMEDGLYFYREITKGAAEYLDKEGYLLYETGCNQAREVSDIMKENGFTDIKVVKDMAGLDRVVTGRLNH